MKDLATLIATWMASPQEPLHESLATHPNFLLSLHCLPDRHRIRWEPNPGQDRLHLILQGRCRVFFGATEMVASEGLGVGIGAPGPHELEAEGGVVCVTVGFEADGRLPLGPGGITVLNLQGTAESGAGPDLGGWNNRPLVGGRLSLLTLSPRDSAPMRSFSRASRYILTLKGTLLLGLEAGDLTAEAPHLARIPPETPHEVRAGRASPVLALSFSDEERAIEQFEGFRCGAHVRSCDYARMAGDGWLIVQRDGSILQASGAAPRLIPGVDAPEGERRNLFGLLPPTSSAWLREVLGREGGPPVETVWAREREGQPSVHVLGVRYTGEGREGCFLLFLRPSRARSGAPVFDELSSPAIPSEPAPAPAPPPHPLVGISPRIRAVHQAAESLASPEDRVVVLGDTGTGKSLLARWIHRLNSPSGAPLRVVDLSKMDFDLAWRMLCGRSASGLRVAPAGPWLREPGGGTLILEQIQALTVTRQNLILKALCAPSPADYPPRRVIVEMHRRPEKGLPGASLDGKKVRRGSFRVLEIPPLQDRKEDVPLLLETFLSRWTPIGKPQPLLQEAVLPVLLEGDFPRNLHDLESLAKHLIGLPVPSPIGPSALQPLMTRSRPVWESPEPLPTLKRMERELLGRALVRAGGNKSEVCRVLGISRTRLYRLLAEHQLEE